MEILELLVILGAIYVYECVLWVPLETVGFSALLPWRIRASSPWEISGGRSKGVLLGAPWPPLTPPFLAEPLPVIIGPRGIAPRSDLSKFIRWEEVTEAAAGGVTFFVNGEPFATTSSSRLAFELAKLATAVRPPHCVEEGKRTKRLAAFLNRRFDHQAVRDRVRVFESKTWWIAVGQHLLFASVFLGIPIVGLTSFIQYWPAVPLLALIGIITTIVSFRFALRRADLLPKEARPDRVHRILVAISPLSTMRARDLLARELLSDLAPIAVSSALLGRSDFRDYARKHLAELTYIDFLSGRGPAGKADPESSEDKGNAVALEAKWLHGQLRDRLEHLLAYKEIAPSELLAPPPREAEEVIVYCPICLGQYSKGEICPQFSCREVALRPLEETAKPKSS